VTEYKVDDKVWVKATIREVDVDTLRIELPGAANKWVTRWDARPRADAAPDVAALRAACEMALGFLNANLSQRIQTHSLVFSALRAALAAAPKAEPFEGVRVGDFVHDTELYQVCEIDGSNAKITSGRAMRTVCVKSLSFVDRPLTARRRRSPRTLAESAAGVGRTPLGYTTSIAAPILTV